MAVTPGKWRLGAPDSIILDYGTASPVDLGSSMGGLLINYKPNYFKMKIDQSLGPTAAWRIDEEATVEMSLVEMQVQKLLVAMSMPTTGVVSTVGGTPLPAPAAPTFVVNGTAGAVSRSYQIVAVNSNGDSVPSTATVVATGAATLTAVNSITLSWTAVAGATGYRVIRSASGGTDGTGQVTTVPVGALTFTDTGAVAPTAYTPVATGANVPSTDTGYVGSTVNVPIHTLDVAVPKNDGTNLHWRYKFWRCFGEAPVMIDNKRDKNNEYKVQMFLLADTTQPLGQQLFRMVEETA